MSRSMRSLAVLFLLFPAIAPGALRRAPAEPAQNKTSPAVGGATITLDVTPDGRDTVPVQRLFFGSANAFGMSAVPDMHTAVMQQPDGSYKLWIAGRFENVDFEGSTGQITTSDFQSYARGSLTDSTGLLVAPDLVPTCRAATESTACWNNFDAVYTGADLVFRGTDGALRMLYHGGNSYFGGLPPDSSTSNYCEVGLARSQDEGVTWSGGVPIISGSDPKPGTDPPVAGIYGAVEPGAIVANGYIYCYYAYFGLANSGRNPPVLQVARAPVSGNGAPGTWSKYYNGSFSQSALMGGAGSTSLGSQIVPTIDGCTRPAQPWPVYSTYLNKWVLVYIGREGWFFTTSPDLVNWNIPARFFPFAGDSALNNFRNGYESYENVILVTPGNPEQVIGRTGLVVYAYTASWGHESHMLWTRPFKFDFSPAGVEPAPTSALNTCELSGAYPNPFERETTIDYRLSFASKVSLKIYDVRGRRITTLVDQAELAGEHSVRFDASGLAPGVFECRLAVGGATRDRRMVFLR